MDYLEAKINQLVVEKSDEQKIFIRSFATKPTKNLAGRIGKIFGLIEIESAHPQIPDLIDLIIEEIKSNYYHQSNFKSEDNSVDIGNQFETTLKKTNLAIASFLESEYIDLDLEKINIIIVLSCGQELHLTLVGNIGVIFFYNIARGNYRIVNILETTQSTVTVPDPLKFFSQVVSGRIRPRDILFITTTNLLDFFSLDRIKNIITDQLPIDGMAELRQLLTEIDSKQNFGALTLELAKVTVPTKKTINIQEFDYRQAASKDSIKELIKTEKETEKLLTPSLLPEIKKYANSFKMAFENYLNKTKSTTSTLYQKQKNIIRPNLNLKTNLNLGKKINRVTRIGFNSIKKISSLIKSGIKKAISVIASQLFWRKLSSLIKQLFGQVAVRFNRLPKSSKLFLIIIIILIVLFIQNVIWLGIKNQREEKMERFSQTIVDVETKKNDAESSLIYRDENQARQILIEAKNLLTTLDPDSKAREQQVAMLFTEIEDQLQKLRHVIEITEPVQIVNFANLDSQANIANLTVTSRNTVYTQNLNNQSLYKANLDSRVMSAIYSPNSNTGNLIFGLAISNSELIFFNRSMSAFRLNPTDNTLQTITININDSANITDAAAYNNRLYLLDAANNQIYRYSKTTSGYGNIREWIAEEGVDLANAVSLIIDGSIYVLKSDGEIIKLLNGAVVDWQINTIDPPFESPTKIKTTEASDYLYILDPPTKRLVVLDKDGNLVNQYTSESFDNLKDFIVDEGGKEIYFLNGSVIFGVPMEHL